MNAQLAPTSVDGLSMRDRKRVVSFVTGQAGIQLPDSKQTLIESRLRKRQRYLGFTNLHEYIDFVFEKPQGNTEKVHLLDALTTNKTEFYREAHHFHFLINYVTDRMPEHRWLSKTPFTVWSAGCSSGEEAYTLAIEFSELQQQRPEFRFSIFASDISVSCLATAREGIYPMERIAPVPEPLRKRYLLRSKDRTRNLVAMSPVLQKNIYFQEFNLLAETFPKANSFDVVFCRNVMIYFSNTHRASIARRFHNCLKPDGLLILGHSETLIGNSDFYRQLEPTIYQKIRLQSGND